MSCTVAVPLRQLAKISYWHWGHLQCNVDFTLIFICLSFKGNANWILISSGNGWWNIYTPASSTSACGVATHQARGENQCVEIGAGADKQPRPRRNADFTISQWRQKPGVSGCKWVFIQCKRGISPCSPSSPPHPTSLCVGVIVHVCWSRAPPAASDPVIGTTRTQLCLVHLARS